MTSTPPLRVLHLGKFFPPHVGGMETYLADLIEAQRQQGLEASALVHGNPQPADPPWLQRVPVQWQLLYAPIAVGYPKALAHAIHKFQPDVLHLHMPNNSVFWALLVPAARRLPWVVHWHSDVLVTDTRTTLSLAYLAYRPFEQAVLARAHRIAVTSPPYLEASEPLRAWADKCEVVPLGLRTPALEPALPTPPAWPSSNPALRVLAIGRLAHYKGFETLIDAVAQTPGVELLIAGDGELRSALQARMDGHQPSTTAPRMRLLGAVSEADKQQLLAHCDLFALPSCERTEAFGMVLLEAMSHSKPCLVSALPGSGMPWVVASSQAGHLAPQQDVAAWSHALLWMARHPEQRQTMGAAGRCAFEQRFTAGASARALQPLYPNQSEQSGAKAVPARTLIVIPARDEAATLGDLLAQLHAAGHHDVLVIDDLSSDGTGDIARAGGARVLRPVLGLGAWGGMQTGLRYALRHGFDCAITMDADGQHEVPELAHLLRASADADVVIGAFPERASALRRIAWDWFRLLTGLDVTDLTSGFRCYRGDALRVLASSEATLLDYQDVGTLLMLRRAGLSVVEVPVRMNERVAGASRIFGSWLKVARYMAITTLLCLSRWRIGSARTRP